jgi:sugar/nucleoside kinase (ribokinase family)
MPSNKIDKVMDSTGAGDAFVRILICNIKDVKPSRERLDILKLALNCKRRLIAG